MTSLQGSLPDTASGLWRMDREYGVSDARVKHIVIHEAHIREVPDKHVVYRIDVFTTERNWCVYRRYSEFHKLHDRISDRFKMFKGSFPPKQMSGNLSPAVIEQRRSALEHYLLKIINCHNQEVSACNTVLRFLDLQHNDVYYVSSGLCRYIKMFGDAILNENHYFVLSPTQMFCIHKRLRIPNNDADFKADTIFCDLSSLYDFLGRLTKVCIKPLSLQDHGIRSEITLLKQLKELHIQTYSVSLIKGLATIQLQIQRMKASQAVTAMKDLLIDAVLERKTQPKPPKPTEMTDGSWRSAYNSRAIHSSYTIHPWISLLYLDISHNTIRQLDDSFSLLPNLQELDLSYNQIEVLDLNYINPSLTKITCTHSNVMKVITKLHENLAEIRLDTNKLTELTGFNKLVVLKRIFLKSNGVTSLDNIACLTELPRLHEIAILDNPISKKRSYRHQILCMFTQACRRDDIVVDGRGFSDSEKKKAKNTRVKSTASHIPTDLPFLGTTSEQIPTAFLRDRENMWNSILHDDTLVSTSSGEVSPSHSPQPSPTLSPAHSDIRSTPSQPRTYDWDPAQAFASSVNSTPSKVLSHHGSSTCLDTSSCCEEDCEIALNEECSLEKVSPIESFKPFNSSFYSLSGSSEIYTDNTGSPKVRVNPFGRTGLYPSELAETQSSSRDDPEHEQVTCQSRDDKVGKSSESADNSLVSVDKVADVSTVESAVESALESAGESAVESADSSTGLASGATNLVSCVSTVDPTETNQTSNVVIAVVPNAALLDSSDTGSLEASSIHNSMTGDGNNAVDNISLDGTAPDDNNDEHTGGSTNDNIIVLNEEPDADAKHSSSLDNNDRNVIAIIESAIHDGEKNEVLSDPPDSSGGKDKGEDNDRDNEGEDKEGEEDEEDEDISKIEVSSQSFVVEGPDYDDIIFSGSCIGRVEDDEDEVEDDDELIYEDEPLRHSTMTTSEANTNLDDSTDLNLTDSSSAVALGDISQENKSSEETSSPESRDIETSNLETEGESRDTATANQETEGESRDHLDPSPVYSSCTVSPVFNSSADEFSRENKITSLSMCMETGLDDLYDENSEDSGSEKLSFSNTKLQL